MTNLEDTNSEFNACQFIWKIVSNLILILFCFFTILSLYSMRSPNETSLMPRTIYDKFYYSGSSADYLNLQNLKDDIINRLQDLFMDAKTKAPNNIATFAQASPMRISFYRSETLYNCNNTSTVPISIKDCFGSLYTGDALVTDPNKDYFHLSLCKIY